MTLTLSTPRKAKKPRKATPDAARLRRLAARIDEMRDTRLPELLDELAADEGLVVAQKGTAHVIRMVAVAASSEAGLHMALVNWANAARRMATLAEA